MPSVTTRGRGRRTISEINMVPFIDVMLVLLIIFMVTAPLVTPSVIAVPKVGKTNLPRQPADPVRINVQKDESIAIQFKGQSRPSSLGRVAADVIGLESAVKAAGTQAVPVVISADKGIRYETVVSLMAALHKAGVTRVALAVQGT